MGYPSVPPAPEQLRKICRGNMIPVWSFLLRRVGSERTVTTARRNILVHGVMARRAWEGGPGMGVGDAAEAEARERDLAAEEAERLRRVVRRQRKELRSCTAEVAREEAERKRVLGERSKASLLNQLTEMLQAIALLPDCLPTDRNAGKFQS